MRRSLAITLLGLAAASPATAADWGQVATISSTLGVNAGRLCVGEGTRADIGCPTYAPSVNSGGLLTATALSATTLNGHYASFTTLTAGSVSFTGNLSIEGVTFADGGIQLTGGITGDMASATTINGHYASFTTLTAGSYYGDGSNLTGVTASSMNWYGLTNIPVGVQNISTTELTVAELTQLQNIDTSVLPASVWSNLAYLNQSVSTTSTPTFGGLTLNGNLDMSGQDITADDLSGDYIAVNTVSSTRVSATNVSATTGEIAGDLTVHGNLYVSGSQTIEGVTFANGGLQATGAVTADTLSATTVNGHYASFTTLTAGSYYGDGSGLTGITAAQTDRIISGTTEIIANNNSYVSVTVGGVPVARFNNFGAVFASGALNTSHWGLQNVSASLSVMKNGDSFLNIRTVDNAGSAGVMFNGAGYRGAMYATPQYHIYISPNDEYVKSNVIFMPTRNTYGMSVGIATATPQATLQVSGSFTVSTSAQVATPTLFINTSGQTAFGTKTPSATTHVSGTLMVRGGTGSETCDANYLGLMRRNPTTGRLQACR